MEIKDYIQLCWVLGEYGEPRWMFKGLRKKVKVLERLNKTEEEQD